MHRLGLCVVVVAVIAGVTGCSEPRNTPLDTAVDPMRSDAGDAPGSGKDVPMSPDVPGVMPGPSDDTAGPVADSGCPAGFHACGGKCVDSTQPATCGEVCEPCPTITGGETTCDGTRCGVKCPAGKKACVSAGSCIGMDEVCDGCPAGKNACNNVCVAATDKMACGASCVVCPTSPAGTATCDGTQCALTCNPGFHLCGNDCKSSTLPESCGTSCIPCKPAEGGGASCVNGACQATCPSGLVLCRSNGKCQAAGVACDGTCPAGKSECNGNCVDPNDVNTCGTPCMTCPTPPNADATCDGKGCGFKCRAGFHLCDGLCKPDVSTASCGTRCAPCPTTADGAATCTAGACGLRCDEGFYKCNDTCIAMSAPCGTSCPSGWSLCNGKCYAANGKPAENCANGLDDNCNGMIDCKDAACGDGTSCGGGKICQAGNCLVPCTPMPGTCAANPGASKCIRGKWICNASGNNQCVDDGTTASCVAGQLCQGGTCVAVCTSSGGACQTNPGASSCIRGRLMCNTTTNREDCINDGTASKCLSSEKCEKGACVPCGGLGQPCCAGSFCSAVNTTCKGKDPICVLPGGASGCQFNNHCETTRCNVGYCTFACGGFQQQCCDPQLGDKITCRTDLGLACSGDSCSCGRAGLPCCNPGGTAPYCTDSNSPPTACPASKICP